MNKIWIYILLGVGIFGCTTSKESNGQLQIVATTGMIGDMVTNIVGDKAEVTVLMGPGVDPHLYKATPSDLRALRKADIIFYNGLHLEGNMAEVLEKLGRSQTVVAVADGVDENQLRASDDGSALHDPHIWFGVSIWSQATEYAMNALIQADTINQELYKKQGTAYLNHLSQLHEQVKNSIQQIPEESRVLITAHDAFGYFGEAYNIEVKGLQGISTVAEFGLKDITELVNFIVENKIKAVFVESSVPQKALEAVVSACQEKGHEVKIGGTLYSDAMGEAHTKEGTYIGMVNYNVETIVNALM